MKTYPTEVSSISIEGFPEAIRWASWKHPYNSEREGWLKSAMESFRRFIKPGDTVVDVGAYTGDTALPMALATGPSGVCFAYEPNPYSFEVLVQNSRLNLRLARIIANNFAVGMENKRDTFHYCDEGFCNGGRKLSERTFKVIHTHPLEVEVRNPDLNFEECENFSFLKIDTEGHDLEVLNVFERQIRIHRPTIQTEFYPDLSSVERQALLNRLSEFGYSAFTCGTLEKLDSRDLAQESNFVSDVLFIPNESKIA